MTRGRLTLVEKDNTHNFGIEGDGIGSDINARIDVENAATYKAIAINGVVGAAEAYMDGRTRLHSACLKDLPATVSVEPKKIFLHTTILAMIFSNFSSIPQ